jgi:hypothetical protein
MSAVMTATAPARSTPSYPPRPSQATAPVLEFRCLFTRDAHKKAKKWHDGSLRYHTFNRRVMVYDETKNFMGDVHCREDDEVGEGTELTLDSRVLVEVGEPLGQTQTDLNQVLHHRSSPERPSASTRGVRSVPAASQGKPRSLKEVLGASQGRLGRAQLPSQSPFERRNGQPAADVVEPLPKRQRIACGKENVSQTIPAKSTVQRQKEIGLRSHVVHPTLSSQTIREEVGAVQEILELSSDEEENVPQVRAKPTRTPSLAKPQARPQQAATHTTSATQSATRMTRRVPAEPASASHSKKRLQVPDASARRERSSASSNALLSSKPASSTNGTASVYTPRPGTTQLQFSQKPQRPRLLYSSARRSTQRRSFSRETRSVPNPRPSSVEAEPVLDDESLLDDELVLDDEPVLNGHSPEDLPTDEARTRDERPRNGTSDEAANEPVSINSSPLFIPQGTKDAPSPSQQIESSQDLEVRMLQGRAPLGSTNDDPIPIPASPSDRASTPGSPTPEPSPAPKTTQKRMPPPPLPPPRLLVHPQPAAPLAATRPLRRVLSANDAAPPKTSAPATNPDSDSDSEFAGSTALFADFPPTAVLLRPPPISPAKRAANGIPSLRRTLSDPTHVDAAAGTKAAVSFDGSNGHEGTGEIGPWTSDEAFLLFGEEEWPAAMRGRRPDWATAVVQAGNITSATGTSKGLGSGGRGFASARGLYSLERTAQGVGRLCDNPAMLLL